MPINIFISVFAAGGSLRFGGRKLLYVANSEEKTIIEKTTDNLKFLSQTEPCLESSNITPVYKVLTDPDFKINIITGCENDALHRIFSSENIVLHYNKNWEKGISESLKLSVSLAIEENCRGILILLGDMPCIKKDTILKILEEIEKNPNKICRPYYEKKPGFPVYLPEKFFSEALLLEGDSGARSIIAANPDDLIKVPTDDPDCIFDIDKMEDIEKLK